MRGFVADSTSPSCDGRNSSGMESFRQDLFPASGSGYQQAPCGLWIKSPMSALVRYSVVIFNQALGKLTIVLETRGNVAGAHALDRTLDQWNPFPQKFAAQHSMKPASSRGRARSLRNAEPVTSVIAFTRNFPSTITSAARLFNVVIDCTAASIHAGSAFPLLIAVEITPVPIALVNSKASPGMAPPLVRIFLGCTTPVTEYPNFVSSSRMLCPPITVHPASIIFDRPPARIRSQDREIGFLRKAHESKRSERLATMAYTSLKEFVAAI